MINQILAGVFFLIPGMMDAQHQGKIVFFESQTQKFRDREFTIEHHWELIFTDSMSVCRFLKMEEPEEGMGGVRTFRWGNDPEDVFMTNLVQRTIHDAHFFAGRPFLVQDDFPDAAWKMTGKQGLVESFPAMEMMTVLEGDTILAWVSPKIPLSIGPKEFRGLPGAILFLEVKNSSKKITLKSVDFNYVPTPEDFVVTMPKGKPMKYNDFIKIRAEKMREFQSMYGR